MAYVKYIVAMALLGALLGIHVWDKERALGNLRTTYAVQVAEAKTKTIEAESKLREQKVVSDAKREKDVSELERKHAIAVKRLQQRPSRPAPGTITETVYSCTGAQLYREDGQFLRGEALRADQAVIDRDYYYNAYEQARLKLEELSKGK